MSKPTAVTKFGGLLRRLIAFVIVASSALATGHLTSGWLDALVILAALLVAVLIDPPRRRPRASGGSGKPGPVQA